MAAARKPLPRPLRVRIGHRFYRVAWPDAIALDDAGGAANGMTYYADSRIEVLASLTDDVAAEIFLHECLHASHWEQGLDDGSTEEQYANLDAKGLCRLWQDNPSAMRWWLAALRPPAAESPILAATPV